MNCGQEVFGWAALPEHFEAMVASLVVCRSVTLVVDAPFGHRLPGLGLLPRPILVVTGNHCPYHLLDLLEFAPEGLAAQAVWLSKVRSAVTRVALGENFYHGPIWRSTGAACLQLNARYCGC